MKKAKSNASMITMAVLVATLLLGIFPTQVMAANLGTLSYWESDSSEIRRWSSIPSTIYTQKLNSNGSFYFLMGMVHGIDEWKSSSALNCSMTDSQATTSSSTKVIFYGGTKAELDALGIFSLTSSNTGLTNTTSSSEGTWTYGSTTKDGKLISKVRGCIVDKSRTTDQYKNTSTHELGHGLGWAGHSSNSSDVLYASATSITSLTTRDKRHLKQVY